MGKPAFIESELERRARLNRRRTLHPVVPTSGVEVEIDGRPTVNFSSNDYLGLSKHPLLKERAFQFMEKYGAGSTASRLICGSYDCFQEVESRLADLKQTEAALIFNSGFQANVSLLPALADRKSLVLSDRLNHRSLVEGALLCRCRVIRFRHNDLGHLRELLRQHAGQGYSRILIVTESVFSVDGDRSDVPQIARLAQEFGAMLMVDEAHATGVLGPKGMGLTCGHEIDLAMGTFGKACGSFGAYVACSSRMREYLVNCCSGFVYTTALPPVVIGSIDAALDLIPSMDRDRRDLLGKADTIRTALHRLGWSTGNSSTQIIPVMIGDEAEALALSAWLEAKGILAIAIRPPTVEKGQSRIRLALSALHTQEHIAQLVEAFTSWAARGA